jgi:serine/threonine protein phosphatase PrpC
LVNKNNIWFAHAGDARALYVEDNFLKYSTIDHKALSREEIIRIQRFGGFVSDSGRVNGTIAVSRAIGDVLIHPFVIPEPDITNIQIEGDPNFLILACDGVWDVISNELAVELVQDYYQKNQTIEGCANKIRDFAYQGGSLDNITVLIVDLKRL